MGMTESQPRILIFSQRHIFGKALFRCAHFEFEDLICQMDSAEILAPHANPSGSRHSIAKHVAYHAPVILNPGIRSSSPQRSYDLFVAICGAATDLLMIDAVSNWKAACKTSLCLIDELWVKEMAGSRHFLRVLEKFDVVMLYYSQSVEELSRRIGRKCRFLPPGVDGLIFCPYPKPLPRVIDVYSMGRRSEITHQALLKMASEYGLFYLHDTVAGDQAINAKEHRALFVNLVKRSKYFITNPGLIDRPDRRGNQIEIGNRYYEGAAAGTILVGERPDNHEFGKLFDWPDALIHLPYNSGDIKHVIDEVERQPERQARIRRANAAQALLRHDWAYRWEAMLKAVGLEPSTELVRRKQILKELAATVLQQEAAPAAT